MMRPIKRRKPPFPVLPRRAQQRYYGSTVQQDGYSSRPKINNQPPPLRERRVLNACTGKGRVLNRHHFHLKSMCVQGELPSRAKAVCAYLWKFTNITPTCIQGKLQTVFNTTVVNTTKEQYCCCSTADSTSQHRLEFCRAAWR